MKTGIRARTLLPSPTYDSAFELYYEDGRCYVRFKRDGSVGRIIMDWWEEVPAPEVTQ